jgi:DHA2 family multidrug resistance protein
MIQRRATENPWLIVAIVVTLAVVEILDMTIVSVALQDMKGSLSAAPDQITWTITIYVVSAAIVMPMSGLLAARFGRKQLLIMSAYGFTLSSFLCGLSQSLFQMVLFRGFQGMFGALLPPLAQATIVDTFSRKDLPKAMAIYGVGLMVGPILGPVLGGMITDHLGWRFIFYVNVPIGIIGALLATRYLPKTPKKDRKIDVYGLILLALCVGCLQFVLDKGNELNWLNSSRIVLAMAVSLICLILFIVKGRQDSNHVIQFKIFRDRNFTLGCLIMFLYCACFLGTLSWLPLMLELFFNFTAQNAGFALMPRGIACLCVILFSARLTKWFDARYLIVAAAVLYAYATHLMTGFALNQGPENLLLPNIIQGVATGLFFVPLNSLAYQSLDPALSTEASGLFNFFRSLGSSTGVAIFSTIMSVEAQINWHQLAQYVSVFNPALHLWAQATNMSLTNPTTVPVIGNIVNNQAYMLAFIDGSYLFSFLMLLLIPFVMMMTPRKAQISSPILE